ncbi:MAG TPA: hypothetical protein V6D22_07950 [Candidatus Obscuribacterales bacterium]
MPDETEPKAKAATVAAAPAHAEGAEHYEEIAEYRIGEGPPPIALVVMFVLIVLWATLSWIPFFGY